MDKLNMETPNLTDKNIEKILALFPNVATEKEDENGKLKIAVDFDKLKQELSDNIVDGEESYDFTWVGKREAMVESNRPIRKTLRPDRESSVNWDTTENLYIEGDNLDALKLLQESYLGQVKMIYIDPPYNTGRDFIYRDNFTNDKEAYEEEIGAIDEEGNRLFQNTETNGRFHSDWCSMIYPRLKLGYNLLDKNGFICISINDVELHNLKSLCDEIFGVDNFINIVTIKSATTASFRAINACPVNVAEYLLLYSKSKDAPINPIYTPVDYSEDYSHIITNFEDSSDGWKLQSLDDLVHSLSGVENWQDYKKIKGEGWKEIRYKEKKEIAYKERHRVVSLNTMQKPSSEVQRIIDLSKDNRGIVYRIDRVSSTPIYVYNGRTLAFFEKKFKEIDGNLLPAEIITNIWTDISYLSLGKEGDINYANGKKPIALINRLNELYTNETDIIMDFFAGSASTAHAVLDLNAKTNSNRRFIMVQLPENLDENLEHTTDQTTKKSLKNSIKFLDEMGKPHILTELGKERIRRVGKKIQEANPDKQIDIGFRVLKVDDTNMKDVYYTPQETDQKTLGTLVSNIKDDRTDEDLLYGVLLDWGVELSLPHKVEEIDGKRVHIVNNDDLVACFESSISEAVIRKIAEKKPTRVVFRDGSFNTDDHKINVEEIFKLLAPDTTVKVI